MVIKKSSAIWIILLMSWFSDATAQTQFIAKADRYTVGKNEQFTVTFSINDQASKFRAPDFGDFQVVQGPLTSQNTVIQNFEMVVQLTYSYVLRPRRIGTFTIGAASIQVGNEKLYTKPLEINVVESSPRSEDPNDPQNIARKLAFTRIKVSKRSVYVGEPFVAKYQLLTRVNVGQPTEIESLSYPSAYKNEIAQNNQNRPDSEIIDGQNFQVFTLKEHLIIPQKAGSFSPGNAAWEIPTQIPTNQRDFFGRQMVQTIKQVSESKFPTVEVKPLPNNNKPNYFSGGVGEFKLSAKLSRTEVKANESIVLTIELSGTGNIKITDFPDVEIPTAIEAFDPKRQENIKESASGMSGFKRVEYLLLPRYKGTYKIPEISFHFFNVKKGSYETLRTDPMQITVTDGPALSGATPLSGTSGNPSGTKEKVTYLENDILFIKTKTDDIKVSPIIWISKPIGKYYWLIYPFLLVFVWLVFTLIKSRNEDSPEQRAKSAKKAIRETLKAAQKQLEKKNQLEFYNSLSIGLWAYFEKKLNLPKSKQNRENLREHLQLNNFTSDQIAKIEKLLNHCEMVKYSPSGSSNMEKDLDDAKALINEVEEKL